MFSFKTAHGQNAAFSWYITNNYWTRCSKARRYNCRRSSTPRFEPTRLRRVYRATLRCSRYRWSSDNVVCHRFSRTYSSSSTFWGNRTLRRRCWTPEIEYSYTNIIQRNATKLLKHHMFHTFNRVKPGALVNKRYEIHDHAAMITMFGLYNR